MGDVISDFFNLTLSRRQHMDENHGTMNDLGVFSLLMWPEPAKQLVGKPRKLCNGA